MNTSQQILDTSLIYGGSDLARPSLNRMQYVRHGSIQEPFELGVLGDLDLFIDGSVGAESGTSTIFYRFRTQEPLRIAARLIPFESTAQGASITSASRASRPARRTSVAEAEKPFSALYLYLSTSLTDQSGQEISTGPSSFEPTPVESDRQQFEVFPADIGYVFTGYWDLGYAEQDGATVDVQVPIVYLSEFEAVAVQNFLEVDTFVAQSVVGSVFIPPILRLQGVETPRPALKSERILPSHFVLAVSSSRWAETPYTLHLALRGPALVRGTALLDLDVVPRLPIKTLSGPITIRLDANGFIPRAQSLEGVANIELRPLARINLTRITEGQTVLPSSISNALSGVTLPNHDEVIIGYDGNNNINVVTYRLNGANVLVLTLTYDNNNNLLGVVRS